MKSSLLFLINREIHLTRGHFRDLAWKYRYEGVLDLVKYDLHASNVYRNKFYSTSAVLGLFVFGLYGGFRGCEHLGPLN